MRIIKWVGLAVLAFLLLFLAIRTVPAYTDTTSPTLPDSWREMAVFDQAALQEFAAGLQAEIEIEVRIL